MGIRGNTMLLGAVLFIAGASAAPPAVNTDFGVREIGSLPRPAEVRPIVAGSSTSSGRPVNIGAIAAIGSAWGRVTSTRRSPQHNRRVGGVRNSYHLSGRAIDLARRPGVSHSAIAAAYRRAGYYLVESLDEGDHSHFAFGSGGRRGAPGLGVLVATGSTGTSAAGTQWKMVSAPR